MGEFERCIEGAGTLDDLPRILEFVETACEDCGVTSEARFDVQLAVEEACANVIEHAYGGSGGPFSLELSANGADLVITLTDEGTTFDPDAITTPNLDIPLEERRIGGLGLHLMKKLMDEVRFSFTRDGNQLRMVKRNVIGASPDG
jgi:serine/threonine-protein kinase RsbW